MHDHAGSESRWDTRVVRARMLAAIRPAAAEALAFYAGVAEYQKSLLHGCKPIAPSTRRSAIESVSDAQSPDSDRRAIHPVDDAARSRGGSRRNAGVSCVVAARRSRASGRIGRGPAQTRARPVAASRALVILLATAAISTRTISVLRFVLEAVLQPFVERRQSQRRRGAVHDPTPAARRAALLQRSSRRGRAARRRPRRKANAGLCAVSDGVGILACPVSVLWRAAVRFPAGLHRRRAENLRIEACDHCHRYLKTIDLTKDGLAVPLVDDIASVSLDLWAHDRGYVRLRTNLLGW